MFSLSGNASGSPMTGYFAEEDVEVMIAVADTMDEITDIVVGNYREWTNSYHVTVYFTSRGLDEFWRRVNEVKK